MTHAELLRADFDDNIAMRCAELFKAVRLSIEDSRAEPDPARVITEIGDTVKARTQQYIEEIDAICQHYKERTS